MQCLHETENIHDLWHYYYYCCCCYYFLWLCSSAWATASSFTMFLDHTQQHTTVGRTPLDKWSARHRDLYLTTHNTHNRQTSVSPIRFEPTIAAGERPQTYTLDRAATGTGWCATAYKIIPYTSRDWLRWIEYWLCLTFVQEEDVGIPYACAWHLSATVWTYIGRTATRRCGNTVCMCMTSVCNGLNLHRTDSNKYQATVSQFHFSFMHRIFSSKNSEYDQFSRHYRNTFITTYSLLVTYNMQSQVQLWYLPHPSHLYLRHIKAKRTS
jgi:hypothetical protein